MKTQLNLMRSIYGKESAAPHGACLAGILRSRGCAPRRGASPRAIAPLAPPAPHKLQMREASLRTPKHPSDAQRPHIKAVPLLLGTPWAGLMLKRRRQGGCLKTSIFAFFILVSY